MAFRSGQHISRVPIRTALLQSSVVSRWLCWVPAEKQAIFNPASPLPDEVYFILLFIKLTLYWSDNFQTSRKSSDRLKFTGEGEEGGNSIPPTSLPWRHLYSAHPQTAGALHVHHPDFYFNDNFGKCGPISTILSLLHFAINCAWRQYRSKRSTSPHICCLLSSSSEA